MYKRQVHRYLDQGAPLEICREDPVAFSQDAVQRCSTGKKPLILTETGAVNDRHVGPFRFYSADHGGRIFDDVTYPAFFCGAAGSGHIWHWDCYVDAQNLWPHFRPLHDALEGVQVDAENFQPDSIPDERAWILEMCIRDRPEGERFRADLGEKKREKEEFFGRVEKERRR